MSRDKGARGEREVKDLLNAFFEEIGYNVQMKRNQFQTLEGGYDLVGLPFLAIEIKFVEQLALNSWWAQTVEQTKPGQHPVLFYRQSRKPWRVRMIGAPKPDSVAMRINLVIDISVDDFLRWLKEMLITQTGEEL